MASKRVTGWTGGLGWRSTFNDSVKHASVLLVFCFSFSDWSVPHELAKYVPQFIVNCEYHLTSRASQTLLFFGKAFKIYYYYFFFINSLTLILAHKLLQI